MADIDVGRLVRLLREMDHQQSVTDEAGEREIAWYYWQSAIEELLGLEQGALCTGAPEEFRECDNETHGHSWQ